MIDWIIWNKIGIKLMGEKRHFKEAEHPYMDSWY